MQYYYRTEEGSVETIEMWPDQFNEATDKSPFAEVSTCERPRKILMQTLKTKKSNTTNNSPPEKINKQTKIASLYIVANLTKVPLEAPNSHFLTSLF